MRRNQCCILIVVRISVRKIVFQSRLRKLHVLSYHELRELFPKIHHHLLPAHRSRRFFYIYFHDLFRAVNQTKHKMIVRAMVIYERIIIIIKQCFTENCVIQASSAFIKPIFFSNLFPRYSGQMLFGERPRCWSLLCVTLLLQQSHWTVLAIHIQRSARKRK